MENKENLSLIDKPWSIDAEEIIKQLKVDIEKGLSEEEIKKRKEKFGLNRLQHTEKKSAWSILFEQVKSLVVVLLIAAAFLSLFFGELIEALSIFGVILINTAIGFFTEYRAVRSMEAIQELTKVHLRVLRDGKVHEISAEKVVPGDVIVLDGGDVVAADVRLFEASKLKANESTLTGESVPVDKQTAKLEEDVPLAERKNMVFKGTTITRGSGRGVVVSTGMDTELGQISSLVAKAEEEITPLEKRLNKLGQNLVWVTLGIAALISLTGILVGKDVFLIIETSIALAVATVPEGLPIVATIALARGLFRMAERQALVNRLSAVETLGATNVICTDKTGTLTENQMTLKEIETVFGKIEVSGEGLQAEGEFTHDDKKISPEENNVLREIIRTGMMCNNAKLQLDVEKQRDKTSGEPMEIALLIAGRKAGWTREELTDEYPEFREEAFDPELKMMATVHKYNGNYIYAIKGAVESVIEKSKHILTKEGEEELNEESREKWMKKNSEMAEEGLRVIAMAKKESPEEDEDPYKDMTFLGLAGLLDPPREEVRDSLAACDRAGINVVMVTGDHPVTAERIAESVRLVKEGEDAEAILGEIIKNPDDLSEEEKEKILNSRVIARVSPKQKLDLITLHQQTGAIVAMTGDGVNDAPALKKADIGVAMGMRGTEAAKEAADMVLKNDAFSTIVVAVRQGRVIFENIRKFAFYLLSCNLSEILVISLASVINAPLPILPLQILFLNLVTDIFPALALGVGEGDPSIMEKQPRNPDENILTRGHWGAISGYGVIIGLTVLGTFAFSRNVLQADNAGTVTISFLTLATAQLWQVFNMRDRYSGLIRNEVTRNFYVWGAVLLSAGLLVAAVYVPFLRNILSTTDPGVNGWTTVLLASIIPLIIGQALKTISKPLNWEIRF